MLELEPEPSKATGSSAFGLGGVQVKAAVGATAPKFGEHPVTELSHSSWSWYGLWLISWLKLPFEFEPIAVPKSKLHLSPFSPARFVSNHPAAVGSVIVSLC